jgi:hypothetical protein
MRQHPYPNFQKALTALAPTNRQRAALLAVSERAIAYYLAGEILPPVEKVKLFPTLDHALTLDLAPKIDLEMAQVPA